MVRPIRELLRVSERIWARTWLCREDNFGAIEVELELEVVTVVVVVFVVELEGVGLVLSLLLVPVLVLLLPTLLLSTIL